MKFINAKTINGIPTLLNVDKIDRIEYGIKGCNIFINDEYFITEEFIEELEEILEANGVEIINK